MSDTRDRVTKIIKEIIEMDLASDELFSDAGVDSLMALDILTELERGFSFKIPEENLREFTTIDSIVALVERILG